MTRQSAKWWLIFGAATGALIATDRRTSQQLPSTGHQVAFSRDVSQLGAAYTLVPIAGAFYLGGVLTKQSKLRDTGLLGGEALVDGLIVSEVFKAATGRQRPLEGDGGVHFFHGSDGFPSGHTIGSFAFASVIAHRYHDNIPVVILAYGLATMVGASRFGARQHSAAVRLPVSCLARPNWTFCSRTTNSVRIQCRCRRWSGRSSKRIPHAADQRWPSACWGIS